MIVSVRLAKREVHKTQRKRGNRSIEMLRAIPPNLLWHLYLHPGFLRQGQADLHPLLPTRHGPDIVTKALFGEHDAECPF